MLQWQLAQYLEPTTRTTVLVEEVLDFFSQILQGLEHVHGAGLIHRDLKPANIFLSKDNSGGSRSAAAAAANHVSLRFEAASR